MTFMTSHLSSEGSFGILNSMHQSNVRLVDQWQERHAILQPSTWLEFDENVMSEVISCHIIFHTPSNMT